MALPSFSFLPPFPLRRTLAATALVCVAAAHPAAAQSLTFTIEPYSGYVGFMSVGGDESLFVRSANGDMTGEANTSSSTNFNNWEDFVAETQNTWTLTTGYNSDSPVDYTFQVDLGGLEPPSIYAPTILMPAAEDTVSPDVSFSWTEVSPDILFFRYNLYNFTTQAYEGAEIDTSLTSWTPSAPLAAGYYAFYLTGTIPTELLNGSISATTPTNDLGEELSGWNFYGSVVLYTQINFTVEGAPIPEPSTWALLAGLGVLAVAGLRRRRRA